MILFRAEATFASSISKFGKLFPETVREDLNSSNEATITMLPMEKSEWVVTWFLNRIFHTNFAHDRYSRRQVPFPPSTPIGPFRLLLTAPDSILPCLASKLLLIVGNRYLLMNLHIVQFQYFFELIRLTYPQFVQTFPRCHRMESLTSTIEFNPISYRTPENYRHEEWKRKNQHCLKLYHERKSLQNCRRSWRRSVFLAETGPLFWAFCSSRPNFFLNWEFWMILLRAEAILASSISKFGKSLP